MARSKKDANREPRISDNPSVYIVGFLAAAIVMALLGLGLPFGTVDNNVRGVRIFCGLSVFVSVFIVFCTLNWGMNPGRGSK